MLPDDCLDFFFEWAGYLLIPSSRMQVALLLEGSGDTGKSTLLAIIGAVLGDGSVRNVSLQKLSENTFAAAELHGCLANICADLDARAVRHSGTFKQIVAGDRMTVERKYEQPFSYRPYARLMFSANEAPGTADQSDAYYKRWMVLPMHRKVSQARQDPNLIYALTTPPELSGLLRESVDGLRRLIGRGRFDVAPSMGRAAQEYRARTDTVVAFVNEKCALDPETRIRSGQLYEEYRVWCSANNRQPLGQQRLIEHLQTTYSGVTYKPKLNGYPTWLGLTLATLAPPRDVEGATAPDEREDTHKSAPALYPETEEILNVARALGFPSVAIDRTRVHGTPAAWQAAIRRLPPDGRLKLYAELEKLEQAG